MAIKITTPMSILIFFYALIIGLSFIILGLGVVTAYDINHYLNNQEDFLAIKQCKRYFQQEEYILYERCYHQAIKYFSLQKEE